jgi:hypothetical protein
MTSGFFAFAAIAVASNGKSFRFINPLEELSKIAIAIRIGHE